MDFAAWREETQDPLTLISSREATRETCQNRNPNFSMDPLRIDPDCSVKLCVTFEGYFKKTNSSAKMYCKGRDLEWIVDKDQFSILDLTDHLAKHYEWGRTQMLNIWYMDCQSGTYKTLTTDSQLLDLIDKCRVDKLVRLHAAVVDCSPPHTTHQSTDITQPTQPTQPVLSSMNDASQPNDMEVGEEEHVGDSDKDSQEVCSIRSYHTFSESDNDHEVEEEIDEWVESDLRETIHSYDIENPCIDEGSRFANIEDFRKAIRQNAILNEYEYKIEKTDKKRFRARCADIECGWRIHGSVLQNGTTFMVKVNKQAHTCSTVNKQAKGKMATQGWVCDKILKWLKANPNLGPKDLQDRLFDQYDIRVPYGRVFAGKEMALQKLYGKWEDSYSLLYSFKEALLIACPESLVEIDTENFKGQVCFRRVFIALKPCIDGFIQGCRPYIGIDATFLTGKHRGQLAAAVAVDGHNWLFPVAYGILESETAASWEWFLQNLKKAIDKPRGLVISSDASKSIDAAVRKVFGDAEHRECMMHLWKNFKKKFHGPVFKRNMWSAAYSYTIKNFNLYMGNIIEKHPEVIEYLRTNHHHLWSRSTFSEQSKVDYVNNNLSESFNSWIMKLKGLQIVDLLDGIRQLIMEKFESRRRIGSKFKGRILPSIIKDLNKRSRGLRNYKVNRSNLYTAEVSGRDAEGEEWRHTINLDHHVCTCKQKFN